MTKARSRFTVLSKKRPTLLPALALSCALCMQLSVAAAGTPKIFNIEREDLASALNQFAAQNDRQILFSTDLSKYSANATLYYETREWGMRISEAYRGQYLDSAGGNGNIGEGYEVTNNVDFATHYNVTPRIKVTLEGINMTNQHIVQFTDIYAKRIEVNTSSGRTFLLGATAEF